MLSQSSSAEEKCSVHRGGTSGIVYITHTHAKMHTDTYRHTHQRLMESSERHKR